MQEMRLFKYSNYLKNILTLLSGAAAAQALLLLIYPLLTRIYSPGDFAEFGIFSAFVLIIGEVANGRYDLCIMLPKRKEDAEKLFLFSILIALTISLVLLPSFYILANPLAVFLNIDAHQKWLLFIPMAIFLTGWIQACTQYLNRLKQYKKITIMRMSQSVVTAIVSLSIAYFTTISSGLIIGFILGQIAASIFALIFLWPYHVLINRPIISEQLKVAKLYTAFPKYSVLGTWMSTASRQLPFFLFPYFYGKEMLGYFSLAYRVLGVPLSIIGSSVAQVFYEKASRAHIQGQFYLQKIVISTIKKLVIMGIIPLILLLFFSPIIFSVLFGIQWEQAGLYASILVLWMFLSTLLSPISFVIDVIGKLKFELYYNGFVFCLRIVVILLGGMYLSDLQTIKIYCLVGVLTALFYLFYLLKQTGLSPLIAIQRLLSADKK